MAQNSTETDPFAVPMIFLRIGWMNRYQGQTGSDQIRGGGAFVEQHGFGHEIFNFQPSEGRVYGYVQPPGSGYNQPHGPAIGIHRLGAGDADEFMSGVLVIWVATSPQGGSYIVGWYANATVYRNWQPPPANANRRYGGVDFGYYVTALSDDAVLLPPDERLFEVPRGEGGMGQSNVWYADSPEHHQQIREDVLRLVATRRLPFGSGSSTPVQTDPFLRQKVEHAAVEITTAHYSRLGYTVDSVENDNLGWDLCAVFGQNQLKLEVKGLSGPDIRVELTPNEFDKMRKHLDSYRLCVVTNALTSPTLTVFSYSQDTQRWEDSDGQVLAIDEIVAARCRICD